MERIHWNCVWNFEELFLPEAIVCCCSFSSSRYDVQVAFCAQYTQIIPLPEPSASSVFPISLISILIPFPSPLLDIQCIRSGDGMAYFPINFSQLLFLLSSFLLEGCVDRKYFINDVYPLCSSRHQVYSRQEHGNSPYLQYNCQCRQWKHKCSRLLQSVCACFNIMSFNTWELPMKKKS